MQMASSRQDSLNYGSCMGKLGVFVPWSAQLTLFAATRAITLAVEYGNLCRDVFRLALVWELCETGLSARF